MNNVLYGCKANKILHFLELVDQEIFSTGSVGGYTEGDVGKPARGEIMPSYLYSFTNRLGILFKAPALWADAFYKSKCPYVFSVFFCVSVCVFTFEVPFNGLYAPTSRSRMSNIFRDSESLGKSNGKKWSHI